MRDHPRAEFASDIELELEGTRLSGNSLNISPGGAFVAAKPLPAVGARVTLIIRLPGIPDVCTIPCVVRWSKVDEGVGLQFESLRPIEVWAINNVMRAAKPAS
jgi:hypothetical protein